MDGYVTEHSEKRTVNGGEIEIVMYQGEHCDEYLVREVKTLRSEDWNGLGGKVHRCIKNCKHGLELVVKGNGVVYRGSFDDVESMKREGRGMEFCFLFKSCVVLGQMDEESCERKRKMGKVG